MSKKYITVQRIEERDKKGTKTVIPPGKELDLTPAQAKKYGAAIQEVKVAEPEADDDEDTGGEGGEGGEGGGA